MKYLLSFFCLVGLVHGSTLTGTIDPPQFRNTIPLGGLEYFFRFEQAQCKLGAGSAAFSNIVSGNSNTLVRSTGATWTCPTAEKGGNIFENARNGVVLRDNTLSTDSGFLISSGTISTAVESSIGVSEGLSVAVWYSVDNVSDSVYAAGTHSLLVIGDSSPSGVSCGTDFELRLIYDSSFENCLVSFGL